MRNHSVGCLKSWATLSRRHFWSWAFGAGRWRRLRRKADPQHQRMFDARVNAPGRTERLGRTAWRGSGRPRRSAASGGRDRRGCRRSLARAARPGRADLEHSPGGPSRCSKQGRQPDRGGAGAEGRRHRARLPESSTARSTACPPRTSTTSSSSATAPAGRADSACCAWSSRSTAGRSSRARPVSSSIATAGSSRASGRMVPARARLAAPGRRRRPDRRRGGRSGCSPPKGRSRRPTAFTVAGEPRGWDRARRKRRLRRRPHHGAQVLFPLAPGSSCRAWSLVVFTDGRRGLVRDGRRGQPATVLWRKNIRNHASTQDARFRVYVQADGTTPADSPAPQSPNDAGRRRRHAVPGDRARRSCSMHDGAEHRREPERLDRRLPGRRCTANETDRATTSLACLDRTIAGREQRLRHGCGQRARRQRPADRQPRRRARNRDFLGTAPRDFRPTSAAAAGWQPEARADRDRRRHSGTVAIDSSAAAS